MNAKSTREAKKEVLRSFMVTSISQAAKEVFAERGYQGATLEDVAHRLGMSKATIYVYYKNKDDLFLHVVEELVASSLEATTRDAQAPKDPIEKLTGMVYNTLSFYERERDLFQIYLHEKHGLQVAPKDPHKRTLRDMYIQAVDTLAGVLQEGIDAGRIRPMDSRRLAFYLHEMMNSVLLQRIQGKAKTSIDKDVSQLLDLFLRGAEQPSPS
ncbi:MAG: TetR/AcrR family transcriptional regulator [Candidatus Tectomicrobia bacterium]|nr:TetR/AcrR family transcriptional regulator [Candidatus Tectomicrobia bacterium]